MTQQERISQQLVAQQRRNMEVNPGNIAKQKIKEKVARGTK